MMRHLRADPRLWWGALVTSWFWLVGIVVLSLLPPLIKVLIGGNEDDGHGLSGAVLDRGRRRLGAGRGHRARPHRAQDHAGRAPCCLRAFALDLGIATLGAAPAAAPQSAGRRVFLGAGDSRRRRSCRAGDRRRAVHRAGLCRGAGLVGRRLSRAHRRRGQRAQRRVHDRCDGAGGAAAEVRRDAAGVVLRTRRGDAAGGAGDLEDDANLPPHPEEGASRPSRRMGRPMVRDASLRDAPHQRPAYFFRIFNTRSTISPATPR